MSLKDGRSLKKIPIHSCPVCKEVIRNKYVDFDLLNKLYKKKRSPIPTLMRCSKGHIYVLYLYPYGDKIGIRDVDVAMEALDNLQEGEG